MFACPVDVVPYDQEVVNEPRASDDRQLIFHFLAHLAGEIVILSGLQGVILRVIVVYSIPFLEPLFAEIEQNGSVLHVLGPILV